MNKNEYSQTPDAKKTLIPEAIRDAVFETASGKIPFNMTNDYMFRAVFQTNAKALKGLLCSLLHLSDSEVQSVAVTNPILLGETAGSKSFHLDIHLLLNDSTRINLEMQIANRLNWQNRSVMYLCRTYDKLGRGQDYNEAKPAVHIGFLDYTLFAERPEFYAAYKLVNVKSRHVYSDSLTLYVTDLTRIDLATEEDKKYRIDSWARLFKAETWEELKMIAEEDEALYEAAKTLFYNSSEEEIRLRCLDREEYYQDLRNYERKIEQDHIAYEEDLQAHQKLIEQGRIKYEEDIRAYQKTIEQNRIEYDKDIQAYQKTIEQNRIEYDKDIQAYQKTIEQNRVEYDKDIQACQKTIEQNQIEHDKDIQAYQKTIEQNRIEYDKDIQAYQKTIEQNQIEYDKDIQAYQKTIEQNQIEHEQDLEKIAGQAAEIERLRAELAQLRKT